VTNPGLVHPPPYARQLRPISLLTYYTVEIRVYRSRYITIETVRTTISALPPISVPFTPTRPRPNQDSFRTRRHCRPPGCSRDQPEAGHSIPHITQRPLDKLWLDVLSAGIRSAHLLARAWLLPVVSFEGSLGQTRFEHPLCLLDTRSRAGAHNCIGFEVVVSFGALEGTSSIRPVALVLQELFS
jgi:hypothetical protein